MISNHTARIRVVIAEKIPVYREGLLLLLERSGLQVVGAAADARQVLELTTALAPHVLVVDLSIPGLDIIGTVRALRALPEPPRTLLLADEAWLDRATQAILHGAHGVFSKEDDGTLLLKGIHCVAQGQYWVGRKSIANVVDLARQEMAERVDSDRRGRFGLTRRKLEIIAAIANGQTNREIAAALGLSEQTIKHHLSIIFEKTGVSNRLELALFSLANHLVESGSEPTRLRASAADKSHLTR